MPKPLKGYFLPDDPAGSEMGTGDQALDELVSAVEWALESSAAGQKSHAMMAHIRMNRDPEELKYQERFAREKLFDTLCRVRDNLELTQKDFARQHGVPERTLRRLEHLDTQGSYLPHASTLRKLASLCRGLGWEEHAETLEEVAGWERRHRFKGRIKAG